MDEDLKKLEALKVGVGPGAPTPPTWPTEIQKRYFPSRRGGSNAYVSNPLEIDKLPKPQRRLLELLCKAELGENWAHSGLPPDIRSRRRVLGLDPASLMEEQVPCAKLGKGKHPRWKVLKTALEHYGKLYSGPSKRKSEPPPTQAWIAENYFDVDPVRWVELWTEVKARAWGIITAWGEPFDGAIAKLTKTERDEWAKRWTDEIMRSPEQMLRSYAGKTIVRVYEKAGEKVPPFVTAMMSVEEAPPEPEPKPREPSVTPGKYVFLDKQGFDLEAVSKLDAATKKQFMAAAAKMAGKTFKTPKTFFEWEAKQLETTVDGVDIIRWRIALATAPKHPVFDFWLFPFDDGVVFAAGSDKLTGIAMSQSRFLAEGKKPKPELQIIARELQANAPQKLI